MKISPKIGWPYPTWPQRTASLQRRAPQGLARKTWASPGAQNGKAYWIWSDSMFADFVRLFWKVRDFIEFVQCWVLFVSGCFYVFLQFNFPLASDLTIGFASWWCFFWFFSLLRHRKIPLEGFQLSHLNFLMDCKGYIMWHTTWDAHPMVQEEKPRSDVSFLEDQLTSEVVRYNALAMSRIAKDDAATSNSWGIATTMAPGD